MHFQRNLFSIVISASMRQHLETIYATCQQNKPKKNQLNHVCTTCEQAYPTKCLLKKHIKENHEPNKVYPCDGCDKSFPRKFNLTRHVKEVHENKNERPSNHCVLCNKDFTDIRNLNRHLLNKHGIHHNKSETIIQSSVGFFKSRAY